MAKVTLDAGVCGFKTVITAECPDGMTVTLGFESECPHIQRAAESIEPLDAYTELFKKPCETSVYEVFAQHLPHVVCPVYSATLKAAEVAAGLALPHDVTMKIER